MTRYAARFGFALLVGFVLAGLASWQPSKEDLQRARQLQQEVSQHFRDKKYEEAAKLCQELMELMPKSSVPPYNLACAQARLGKKADALTSLTKSIELGYSEAAHMQQDEDLATLREDKRFAELVTKARENRKKAIAALPYDKGEEIEGVKSLEASPDEGLRYRLRVSEKATADKPHRLIIWLHPSGGSMNNVVEKLSPTFAEHGYALLVLTQKQFMGWSNDDATRLLEHTLPEVAKNKMVDVKKPILLGYSAGGQMALELWHKDPERWGGLVLDAAYPVEMKEGRFVPRPLPEKEGIKKVPMFVLVGNKDGGAPLWEKLTPDWKKAGVPLTIRHIEGKGHTWLFGKAEVDLLAKWLDEVAAGKLPSDSRKVIY
ncbi:MAG: hypothetical protein AB7K24_02800 [Gemmataceae bacterium]